MRTYLTNDGTLNNRLSISFARFLLLYLFSVGTAYIIFSKFFPGLHFRIYLTWPIVAWKDFVIRWLIVDLKMVPSKISIGAVALAVTLIFLSVAIVYAMKLKNKWLSNALILSSLYIQILITCLLCSL
jgi:hypothetical protein